MAFSPMPMAPEVTISTSRPSSRRRETCSATESMNPVDTAPSFMRDDVPILTTTRPTFPRISFLSDIRIPRNGYSLSDGTWVFPVCVWHAAKSAAMIVSQDAGKTWWFRGGATIEPLLDSGIRQTSKNNAEQFLNLLRRNADTAFANGIRDPLILETAPQGESPFRFAFVNQGGDRRSTARYVPISIIPYDFKAFSFFVLKFRLVIGPDLLKERGIKLPNLGK